MSEATILVGDSAEVLATLPDESVQCCVTSPPYWGLRDYGSDRQIGLEDDPEEYVESLVGVFREVRRVLARSGTLWLNLGDSYAGSWGAQGRSGQMADRSIVSARQIDARLDARGRHRGRTGSIPKGSGLKPKDLVGAPWMVAFALRSDGWYLRQDIIWSKPNPMPESIKDRCTKSHEYLFLLSKSRRYKYDQDATRLPHAPGSLERARRERHGGKYTGADKRQHGTLKMGGNYGDAGDPDKVCNPLGRNMRSVWEISTKPYSGAHFAVFPPELVEPCVRAGSAEGDTVLDPFSGAGTTGLVATRLNRNYVGIELNPEYAELSRLRIAGDAPLLRSCEVKTA